MKFNFFSRLSIPISLISLFVNELQVQNQSTDIIFDVIYIVLFIELLKKYVNEALFYFQYNDVLALFESFERMYIQSAYKKYRPDVPVLNHAKAW